MTYRIEKDTLGEVKVPSNVYWGAQTERSRSNFKIGVAGSMPMEIVYGFAYLKKAARVNFVAAFVAGGPLKGPTSLGLGAAFGSGKQFQSLK